MTRRVAVKPLANTITTHIPNSRLLEQFSQQFQSGYRHPNTIWIHYQLLTRPPQVTYIFHLFIMSSEPFKLHHSHGSQGNTTSTNSELGPRLLKNFQKLQNSGLKIKRSKIQANISNCVPLWPQKEFKYDNLLYGMTMMNKSMLQSV